MGRKGQRGTFINPTIKYLLNQTPVDGCLIVFNGDWSNIRSRAKEVGMLSTRVLDEPKGVTVIPGTGIRDVMVYVSDRDEELE